MQTQTPDELIGFILHGFLALVQEVFAVLIFPEKSLRALAIAAAPVPGTKGRPEDRPAERLLEMADGLHGDGIDHLLMELRVALGAGEPVLSEQERMVEIHRRVSAVGCGVDVDHLEIVADRPRLQLALEDDGDGDLVDRGTGAADGKAGIEGESPQPPRRWRRD